MKEEVVKTEELENRVGKVHEYIFGVLDGLDNPKTDPELYIYVSKLMNNILDVLDGE